MTSPYVPDSMTPAERAQCGAALAKGAAFDAVYGLWRRRKAEGWTGARIAAAVDVDEGWLSKQFIGPRNWTMDTTGVLVEGLEGVIEITVRAAEDTMYRQNYDAYIAEYGLSAPQPQLPQHPAEVPPQRSGIVAGSSFDSPANPMISDIFEKIRKNDGAPAPTADLAV
jgi:hypothetical protein